MSHKKIPTADNDFVAFAGPWASARFEWEWDHLHEDDAADFEVYLADQMEHGSDVDLRKIHRLVDRRKEEKWGDEYRALHHNFTTKKAYLELVAEWDAKLTVAERAEAERNALWDIELEPMWPVIEKVADALIDGQEVTEAWIQGLLDA